MTQQGMNVFKRLSFLIFLFFSSAAYTNGVSPYLPLNLAPEVELQIEKLMANK